MSTTKETEGKRPLSLSRPKKLELKKTVETGQVRQSFSHGRSKTVQVEVKRKRTFKPGESGQMAESGTAGLEALEGFDAGEAEALGDLTPAEREARKRALILARQEAERRAVEDEQRAAEEARRLAQEEVDRQAAKDAGEAAFSTPQGAPGEAASRDTAAGKPASGAEAGAEPSGGPTDQAQPGGRAADAGAPDTLSVEKLQTQALGLSDTAAEIAGGKGMVAGRRTLIDDEIGDAAKRKGPAKLTPARTKPERGGERRRHGKLTISQALEDGGDPTRTRSLAAVRRQREREKQRSREQLQSGAKVVREVVIPDAITVQELANRMAERGGEVVKTLMRLGVMATITQTIDPDTAELVVAEFGHRAKRVSEEDIEIGLRGADDATGDRVPRPPVVTVMGHVDHGKTSLLDALRRSDVAAHEAGGITQHIGAYQVQLPSGGRITFIDTPGHAAFTEMRARGATVTDIVVLVVAADDGIMAQTVEAINHAKAAKVPIIVAINKMDKPDANPDRVKTELLQHELVPEDMGGEVICVPVSAKTGEGLGTLEEAILLQAELLELAANPNRPAEGVVVEAKLEQGRGSVATVLVRRGTLKVGDIFVAGGEFGRVRALLSDRGEKLESAGPSVPVEVLGLGGTPNAGDELAVVEDDARAREVAAFRQSKQRKAEIAAQGRGTLEQMLSRIKEGEAQLVPVVVKSDVHGSLEAIMGALEKLGTEEVQVKVLHAGVGGINESDITLARASDAMIIAFNVRANAQARELARRDGVDIRYYSIIYNVIDDMKAAMSGMLSPEQNEKFLGYAEIREVFNITKVGKVAGCMVTEGQVKRGAKVRLLRDDVVIHDGVLKTLRRFKDEVREVQQGYECGMAFENYTDIQPGDRIECYEIEEVARTL